MPEPDRQVWHRAAAAGAPDEALAAELEEAGARALRRGGVAAAQAAVERAARLSADPAQRIRRYLRAAELAFEWGRPDVVDRLLQETAALDVPDRDRIRLTVIRDKSEEGIQGAGTQRLTEVAAAAAADGRTDQALLFLNAASMRSIWSDASAATRARVLEVVEEALDPDDVFALEVISNVAPLDRGAALQSGCARSPPARSTRRRRGPPASRRATRVTCRCPWSCWRRRRRGSAPTVGSGCWAGS